jgi:hypothetical protein
MSLTDKYDLETAAYGTSNWNSILTSNMQKIDDAIQSQMLGTSGEAISTCDAICVHDDAKIYKAITVASGTQYVCLGLSTENIAAADTEMRIYRDGIVTCSGWSWTIGNKVYLDDTVSGSLTQSANTPGINYQLIGIASDTDKITMLLDINGIIDHGNLLGLADDDHTQYHNNARGDARYYTETELDAGQLDNRYYTESEVDTISGSLNTKINGKSDIGHTHSSITGWFDDGANFRVTVTNGVITAIGTTISGGYSV